MIPRLDPGTRVLAQGRVLVGGRPRRVLCLDRAQAGEVTRWRAGRPVSGAHRALARLLVEAGLLRPEPGAGGPRDAEVTAVVPVHGRVRELAACLAGLRGLAVIVVDDGSPDGEAVSKVVSDAGASYVRRETRGGPAAARNTGLAAVTTPYVAFVDSDCVLQPGWLDRLLPHFADEEVAAVAPRVVSYDAGRGWLSRYEAARSALDMGDTASVVRPDGLVPYVPTAALVVRRAAAGAGFDERLPLGEDVDFVWRLAASGRQVRYEPGAKVAHRHRVRLGAWLARRVEYGTAVAALDRRHPGAIPALDASAWGVLAWAAAVCAPGGAAARAGLAAACVAAHAADLAGELPGEPARAAALAAADTLTAGRLAGASVSQVWWPLALPAAIAVPRLRLPLVAALVLPALAEWAERRPPLDPVRYVAAHVLDDVVGAVGVWKGMLRERTFRPLLPRLRRTRSGGP
ncbi:mycofactocin biosynthesis glycosyltransferase MftF [Nonomuraea deserti]|uniref:mycofactocin biosynthesis glycosyltransferase MftF n=1 Tax=Nonomuraea deserti TaxID=1848322 RepID=UPI0014048F13|nr:mycofactocin biosynthesis glycosyltransferase MftF [Nonomuraea deserti]